VRKEKGVREWKGVRWSIYCCRELFIYVVQRGLLKKTTKFGGRKGNKGGSEGVRVREGETRAARGKKNQVARHMGLKQSRREN
jgi:hypothetical protein